MKTIRTYEEFVAFLNEAGFLLFIGSAPLLKLSELTEPSAWHTGDALDPWEWKRELITRHDGVYAKIRRGVNFMLSNEWHPVFLAACQPDEAMEERYDAGEIDPAVWTVYSLFEARPVWSRHELTAETGLKKNVLERALNVLQQEMHITASDEVQRVTRELSPVGWRSMEYTRTDVWAGEALG